MLRRVCFILFLGLLALLPRWADAASNPSPKATANNQTANPNGNDTSDGSAAVSKDGLYTQAAALTYRTMQETAAIIARSDPSPASTYVFFDPAAFAAINQARLFKPQITALKKGLCDATDAATSRPESRPRFQFFEGQLNANAAGSLPSLDVVGAAADTLQKILQMMQTETTVTGANVNVSDAALIAEVAAQLQSANRAVSVYYPGQYLLAKSDSARAIDLLGATSEPCSAQKSVALEVIALSLAQARAQQTYDNLPDSVKPKKAGEAAKNLSPAETKAAENAARLKSYLDSAAALNKVLTTADSNGQYITSKLILGEVLDTIVDRPSTHVIHVKWLRAGALNKSRKNLFFLGQRNYFGAGSTALYEYYDKDQSLLKSGTVTATARWVHDTDFEKSNFKGTIRCLRAADPEGENYACPEEPQPLAIEGSAPKTGR